MIELNQEEKIMRPSLSLIIFDIDDTLFRTTAKVKVMKNETLIKKLNSVEFITYNLGPDEHFNLDEFIDSSKFNQESIPINRMIVKLKQYLTLKDTVVILLTARSDLDNRDIFLNTFQRYGIDTNKLHIHRAGNISGVSIPEKKAYYIKSYLDTGMFDTVVMYDDSKHNLNSMMDLENEYRLVTFIPFVVDVDGHTHLMIR